MSQYLSSELNVVKLTITSDLSLVRRSVIPNAQGLGRKKASYIQTLRIDWQATLDPKSVKAMITQTQRAIDAAVVALSEAEVRTFQESGTHVLRDYPIQLDLNDVIFVYHYDPRSINQKDSTSDWTVETVSANLIVAVNFQSSNELEEEGTVRELMSCVQALRKAANLRALDQIGAYFESNTPS